MHALRQSERHFNTSLYCVAHLSYYTIFIIQICTKVYSREMSDMLLIHSFVHVHVNIIMMMIHIHTHTSVDSMSTMSSHPLYYILCLQYTIVLICVNRVHREDCTTKKKKIIQLYLVTKMLPTIQLKLMLLY